MSHSVLIPLILLQLLLISNVYAVAASDAAESPNGRATETIQQNPLARLLLTRFASSSFSSNNNNQESTTRLGFLRKLADDTDAKQQQFGPGADWSCTSELNAATDHDSCTNSEAIEKTLGGCSWCPLGSSSGVCLSSGQASIINALENDEVLHLECFGKGDENKSPDPHATAFWDETMSCLAHSASDCGGDHENGGHVCTYCKVTDPDMGLCLSEKLWKNLLVAQALEDFDRDWSTGDQIRLDQIIHCSKDKDKAGDPDENIWTDEKCGDETVADDGLCKKEGCAAAESPFPGLLGQTSGKHCVSLQKERAMVWVVELLQSMGWGKEIDSNA